jgi:hypothetical protein
LPAKAQILCPPRLPQRTATHRQASEVGAIG